MKWTADELYEIQYGKKRKRRGKSTYCEEWYPRLVPVPYAQLVQQFLFEEGFAAKIDSHESHRRACYAGQVLDEFAKELMGYDGDDLDFRSFVLTPILQRQLRGIPDAYGPTIQRAVCGANAPGGRVTIEGATQFYLTVDPTNPRCIPSYRRNLIYIREARWHLALQLGLIDIALYRHFNWFLDHHDLVMSKLQPRPPSRTVPAFSLEEVEVIVLEGLQDWFEPELCRVVSVHVNCLHGKRLIA